MNDTWRAIERIRLDLDLPAADAYTQDWAYELPEEYRTREYLGRYTAAYGRPDYGDAEKQELMRVMLDITNELLEDDEGVGLEAWAAVAKCLRKDSKIHLDLIEHWAMPGEAPDNVFSLTPLVRTVRDEVSRDRP